jgi:hypothetical protein
MNALDRLLPTPRLLEADHVDLAAPPAQVWEAVRHEDLARSPFVRALFAVRTLPSRLAGEPVEDRGLRIDDIRSSPEHPGFQVFADDPPREVAVGAIGKVWKLDIPFVHVEDADRYAAFVEPGFVKVAWAIRVAPRGERDSRVEIEVRVDTTDEASWQRFRRYFRLIGPGSHFIRRTVLAELERRFESPESREDERPLPGPSLRGTVP